MSLAACLAIASLGALPDLGPCALIVAPPSEIEMPVVVRVDFAQVARALEMKTPGLKVRPADVRAALVSGRGLRPVACQYDPHGPAVGDLTLALPPSERQQTVAVFFTAAGPRFQAPPSPGAVKVQRRGKAVIVDNGFVRVTHDPTAQAGLPSCWEFLTTGKVFQQFNNNDRVWDKANRHGYHLRNCPDAKVEVVASGPLRAVVRVSAYYCDRDGHRPASKPQAVYEYSYFAGSPFIMLHAQVTQHQPFAWSELHIVEINFPGTDFTRWALPHETGQLVADGKSHRGGPWAALADDAGNTLAVVSGHCIIYDGRGGYGTYLHGPWVQWNGMAEGFDVALYAASGADALARLQAATPAAMAPRAARVSTPGFEAALHSLRQLGGRGQGRWAWVAALLQRLSLTRLADAAALARDAVASAKTHGDAWQWIARARWPYVCIAGDRVGLAVRLDGKVARLASIFDFKWRHELLSPRQGALWALTAEDAGGKQVVADSLLPVASCQRGRRGDEISLRWLPLSHLGLRGAGDVAVNVKLATKGACVVAHLDVDNQSSLTIAEALWPQLYIGPLGSRGDDDVLVQPMGPGRLSRNPTASAPSMKGLYPNGWADMQVFAVYDTDNGGGMVLMCQDPLASTKYIECAADQGAVRMAFRWPAPDFTRPGKDFDPPGRICLQLFDGEWYDAAMVYRRWVSREALWWPQRGKPGRPDTPRWMRDLPLWALYSGPPERVVPPVKAFRRFMGVPCGLHWYNWHKIPFDNDYPHYFPAKPGFAEGVRELQAAGVRVMPYINGRLWDSDTPDFPTRALPFATKDRKGNYYVEVYGSGEKLVPMCPTTKLWQTTVQGIVKRLVGPDYNVDGVYIDQVAAASPRLCFDPTHGHPLGGGHWWTTDGYWPMLSKLQADLARQFPDKMLTTECTAEPYVHVFDGYLSWHWQENNAVPFFPAVYGDKIRLFSRAYRYRGDKAVVFRMRMAQQFVFGEQLGWLDPNIYKDKQIGPYLRRLAKIRWRLRDYFRGRMLRPPALVGDVTDVTGDWAWSKNGPIVTMKAVQAGAFAAEDGRVALVVTNHWRKPQTFALSLPTAEYGVAADAPVRWVGENGPVDRQPARLSGGRLKMTLGPGEAYGLLVGAAQQ